MVMKKYSRNREELRKSRKANGKSGKSLALLTACILALSIATAGCGAAAGSPATESTTAESTTTESTTSESTATDSTAAESTAAESTATESTIAESTAADIEITEKIDNSEDGEHAITADGEAASYSNIAVTKTGEASGDEADFYGENAAIFATNGATLDLTQITVETDGTHANAVFSYGEGTVVNISDSVIETSGNCSGGLMTTGGGTMNAENLTIHTTGNSSAAIRSDWGGGTVNVTGGSYTTEGTGSPVIYSTADITVSNAEMTSTASQGVVVEGQNSVTLNDVTLVASNTTKNSDKSDWYQAVMIYQSMSGDADEGLASFTMNGGSLTNLNGDVFFVNNTTASIDLSGAEIVNEDEEGVFLRAAAAGWGSEGSNGGHVTMTASSQKIDGDLLVDEVSSLNLYLKDGSTFTGAVNPEGEEGEVYVEIEDGSTWILTGDSYITDLTCGENAIDLNGYTLYVGGTAYEAGSASTGEAIEVTVNSSSSHGRASGERPEGAPGERPEGAPGERPEGAPGERPEGAPGERPEGAPGERPEGAPGERPEGAPGEKPEGASDEMPEGESGEQTGNN